MEIYGDTISEVWEKSIFELVRDHSLMIPTERGLCTKEIRNIILHVKYPWKEPKISDKYCFPQKYYEQYYQEIFTKYTQSDNIIYSRIFESGNKKVNQIELVKNKLEENWYSRRAVMSLWVPEEDLISESPPCICMMQVIIREDKLCLAAVFRSNDAWFSALPDMIALSNIQKEIASFLNVECGEYVHHAISYHIYDYDYSKALEVFGE